MAKSLTENAIEFLAARPLGRALARGFGDQVQSAGMPTIDRLATAVVATENVLQWVFRPATGSCIDFSAEEMGYDASAHSVSPHAQSPVAPVASSDETAYYKQRLVQWNRGIQQRFAEPV